MIPDLGFDLEVCPNNGVFQIEISNKQGKRSVEAHVNESTVIEYDQKIAVYISESFGEPTYVQMPSDCKIHVGKSDKVSSDGSRNEIVLQRFGAVQTIWHHSSRYQTAEYFCVPAWRLQAG